MKASFYSNSLIVEFDKFMDLLLERRKQQFISEFVELLKTQDSKRHREEMNRHLNDCLKKHICG